MKLGLAIPLALLLAGCSAEGGEEKAQPDWLVGHWLPVGAYNTPYPLACESDAGILYDADGRFYMDGASGSWKVEGGRLTLIVTPVDDPDPDPDTRIDAETYHLRIERLDGGLLRKHSRDDEAEVFRRCPS